MDRSLGTPASPRIKDVTKQILDTHLIYGASDNTQPRYLSANRSLNYAAGGSIASPEQDRVTVIPYDINYNDTVGLFGKENHFIRVNVKIDDSIAFACFEEEDWECAMISEENPDHDPVYRDYYTATLTPNDTEIENTYYRAVITDNKLRTGYNTLVSVDLNNLKTGNKYIDAWLDVRLYTRDRKEHPYDRMYVAMNDYFYVGFHARNTRRLPYNVELKVGQEFYPEGVPNSDERYLNR